MNLFNRKPYEIRRSGHRVFVKWRKPIKQWSPGSVKAYMPSLRRHAQASVDEKAWSLVGRENTSSYPAYREYVERVRAQLIEEYSLHHIDDQITIGAYHLGLLVLRFTADEPHSFPYCYRGIQLKPLRKTEQPLAGPICTPEDDVVS